MGKYEMSSRFLTTIKEVYGQDIEDDFDMFMRGKLCLIIDFKGKRNLLSIPVHVKICYL